MLVVVVDVNPNQLLYARNPGIGQVPTDVM